MKEVRIVLDVLLPDDFNESNIDEALSDAIYKHGGEMLDSKEYKVKGK